MSDPIEQIRDLISQLDDPVAVEFPDLDTFRTALQQLADERDALHARLARIRGYAASGLAWYGQSPDEKHYRGLLKMIERETNVEEN